MNYLFPEQILAIHDQMIKRFGGSFGLRDMGLFLAAVLRPRASFGGRDLYPNVFDKSAALLQSLLKNHAFVDGNKRTALSAAGVFLRMNGWNLTNQHDEEVEFAVRVDNEHLSVEEITLWLKKHAKKLGKII